MDIRLEPKQGIGYNTPATEFLYGGAAGGMKSFLLRASVIRWCVHVDGLQGYLFRRTLPDLRDNHLRGPTSFFVMLETLLASGHVKYRSVENEFEFWNGSILHLCYCDSENDVEKYRGAEIHVLCCEESERVRMADGSLCRIADIRTGMVVQTLQGPRRVTWTGKRTRRPCVKARASYAGHISEQIHSTTHKLLTPCGWLSYDDIACESLPALICESRRSGFSRKFFAPSANEYRNVSRFRGNPSLDLQRKRESAQLFQDLTDGPETAVCMEPLEMGTGCVASSNGNAALRQPFSGFSFPVVLAEPDPLSGEDACFASILHDAQPYVQNEYRDEDSLGDYHSSFRLSDECLHPCSSTVHDGAHIRGGVGQCNPRRKLLDDLGIIPEHSLYKSLRYCHPYTGEERTAEGVVRSGTCSVAPCGEKWTIDLTVEGENHYITESGFVNQNCIDELTHFSEYQYRFLRSRVRIAGLTVPEKYAGRLPRIETASNPGSVGHAWVKRTFVSPRPAMEIWRAPPEEGGMLRQFIPAKLQDNPYLMLEDPTYADRLRGMGTDDLVRAILEGDWDIIAGQAFEKLRRDIHLIEPFEVPEDWLVFGSFDWGSARPFSFGMWAVSNGEDLPDGRRYPRGAIIRFNEWYGWNGKPNEGLRMEASEVARGCLKRCGDRRLAYCIADSSMWKVESGPSIAETFNSQGLTLRPAPKGPGSRHSGYVEVRGRIAGEEEGPMLYATKNCHDGFWRTMPDLVMDAHAYGLKSEQIDTNQEDHVSDEVMYACVSRPWVEKPKEKKTMRLRDYSFEEKQEETWRTV